MSEALPIACSLSASALKQRLSAIAEIGDESLIDQSTEAGRHLLRFRSDPATRKRLGVIVTAEAECCSFLSLALEERGGDLILSIAAPEEGQAVADELAATFAGASA